MEGEEVAKRWCAQQATQPEREAPPLPGEAKDMSLPPVHVANLDNGMQLNTIVADQLPVVSKYTNNRTT